MAGNIAVSLLIPGGAAMAALLAQLENAVNPLLQSIGTKPTVTNEVMTLYGTMIGILTSLKNQAGLPQATLATVDAYLIAAENGTASYLLASQGFNAAQFQPVTPIA
jgi:hypothetical protein